MWIEVIGYVGMALILVSFLFKKIEVIRVINAFGSIFSLTYGFLTRTWPTAILNISLLIVNCVYLIIYVRKTKGGNTIE